MAFQNITSVKINGVSLRAENFKINSYDLFVEWENNTLDFQNYKLKSETFYKNDDFKIELSANDLAQSEIIALFKEFETLKLEVNNFLRDVIVKSIEIDDFNNNLNTYIITLTPLTPFYTITKLTNLEAEGSEPLYPYAIPQDLTAYTLLSSRASVKYNVFHVKTVPAYLNIKVENPNSTTIKLYDGAEITAPVLQTFTYSGGTGTLILDASPNNLEASFNGVNIFPNLNRNPFFVITKIGDYAFTCSNNLSYSLSFLTYHVLPILTHVV